MKSICRVCQSACDDMSKRYDPALGFICGECHDFLLYADRRLRRVGIQHVTIRPVRFSPKHEKS